MDEKNDQIARRRIAAGRENPKESRAEQQFARDSLFVVVLHHQVLIKEAKPMLRGSRSTRSGNRRSTPTPAARL